MVNYYAQEDDNTGWTIYHFLKLNNNKLVVAQTSSAKGLFLNVQGIVSNTQNYQRKLSIPMDSAGMVEFYLRDLTPEEERVVPEKIKRNKLEGELVFAN